MKFQKNDRVKVIVGAFIGRKGVYIDQASPDTHRVKMTDTQNILGFFEEELVLDEAEMVKVYGAEFSRIAGLVKS